MLGNYSFKISEPSIDKALLNIYTQTELDR